MLIQNALQKARHSINEFYTKRDGKPFDGVKEYHDYRELINNKDIDAVIISTPDHTHAMIGIAAARAKKHIYMQKPASLRFLREELSAISYKRVASNFKLAASNVLPNNSGMRQNW